MTLSLSMEKLLCAPSKASAHGDLWMQVFRLTSNLCRVKLMLNLFATINSLTPLRNICGFVAHHGPPDHTGLCEFDPPRTERRGPS